MKWQIIGQVEALDRNGIKVITETGRKIFILKQTDDQECDFDILKFRIGDRIKAILGGNLSTYLLVKPNWLSKVILSELDKRILTITLHPDHTTPIVLDTYYDGICGFRGKVEEINKDGIKLVPDNLTGYAEGKIFVLRQRGDYTFDFEQLKLEVGDKVETSFEILEKEWFPVTANSIKKLGSLIVPVKADWHWSK